MKVSVIQCTARYGGLDILYRSMIHQTYKNIEVIVADELGRDLSCGDFSGLDIKFIKTPPKKPNMYWNLDASFNEACRHATGDLIVSLQDYIYVPEEGIEKFVKKIELEGDCLVTGVGSQYKSPSNVDNPKGLYSIWNQWPGIPNGEETYHDPRLDQKGFYLCNPVEWELNWGCFKKSLWEKIGGMDEELDAGWGYDNVNFSERAQLAGHNLFIDTFNEIYCYTHLDLLDERAKRDKAPNNQELWHRKYRDLHKGSRNWKLNYANSIS